MHKSIHESVYRHMERRGIFFDVKNEYDTPDIMVGASMNLKVRSPSFSYTTDYHNDVERIFLLSSQLRYDSAQAFKYLVLMGMLSR